MPEISVIVRTKNEERWITHCLGMIFRQDFTDFEVILVDNNSTDHTVQAARRFPIAHVVNITEYKPGFALNEGIRASSGRYIVCLSAHCIPKDEDWLSRLLQNFDDDKIAGVYGRQLPLSFTEAVDKRDMLIVFGEDRRVQIKDCFFHNANSMLRRDVWDAHPFDEEATNIEDRIWGKAVINAGYQIAYEPDAAVFHHHGLHQGNDPSRAKGVVSIIEQIDHATINDLPDSLKPESCGIAAVVPVLGKAAEVGGHNLLQDTIAHLKKSRFVSSINVLAEDKSVKSLVGDGVRLIDRPDWLDSTDKGLEDALQYVLGEIEGNGDYPEAILYINHKFPFRPEGLIDDLIWEAQYKGLDTIFPGYLDYHTYWFKDENEATFTQVGESLMPRDKKKPLYRALYGLGCLTSSAIIRKGRLVGDRVGIVPIEDRLATLLYLDERSEELFGPLVQKIAAQSE
jgi:rhamnosyltransferase